MILIYNFTWCKKLYKNLGKIEERQNTVHRVYYSDQSLGRNGERKEKKWLYRVVNSPMVTYVSTKLNLVTPDWP